MINFPEDHLQYKEPDEFTPRCWNCNDEMYGSHTAFLIDGHWFCYDCFVRFVNDNYSSEEIADALGVDTKRVRDIPEEELCDGC